MRPDKRCARKQPRTCVDKEPWNLQHKKSVALNSLRPGEEENI